MLIKCTSLSLSLNLLAACSVDSNMKHMGRNTDRVAETSDHMATDTKAMRESTDFVAKTSEGMAKDTSAMRESTDLVAKTSEGMAKDTSAMRASTDVVAKTSEGMAKDTSAMRESTEEVAKTSEGMATDTNAMRASTDAVRQSTEVVAKTSDNMYRDKRQSDTAMARAEALRNLTAATDQIAKLTYASQYFMAFEFQLWKDAGNDDATYLDVLRNDAVSEFMREMHRFIPRNKSLSPASKNNDMKSLYALVAVMESINANSVQRPTEPEDLGGMLELLRRGLAAGAEVKALNLANDSLPKYQKSVLEFQSDAVYLLNLRANVIPAMLVTVLASDNGHKLNLIELVRHMMWRWTAHVKNMNESQLESYAILMTKVEATRHALRQIGEQSPVDGKLKKIIKHMRFSSSDFSAISTSRSMLMESLQESFSRLVQ